MALIRNRGEALQERIDKMQRRMEVAQSRLDPTSSSMEIDGKTYCLTPSTALFQCSAADEDLQLPTDRNELSVALSAMENEMQQLRADLETEKAKRLRWKVIESSLYWFDAK